MKNTAKTLFLLPVMLLSLTGCDKSKIPTDSNGNATDFAQVFKEDCKKAFGTVIPFCPCQTYTYEKGVDLYGDPYINVYFSFREMETMNRAYNYYASLCDEAEYNVKSGYYAYYECTYADKVVKGNDAVELVIMTNDNPEAPQLGVFASYYLYEDKNVYPTVAVEKLLGERAKYIPKIEGSGYQYTFYFDYQEMEDGTLYKNLRIMVYNAYYDVEEEYFNALLDKGFKIFDDLTIDDADSKPLREYPEWTGTAFDAYLYTRMGEFILGTYFQYNAFYGAFIVDIFTFGA